MSTEKRVNIGMIGAGWWPNTMQHLGALNVEIAGGPRPRGDGVQQIFICDPDGYMLELFVWEAK
jgi:catechol 2,3-dioxygenase-like lactoylglutathione lyase family enzyme